APPMLRLLRLWAGRALNAIGVPGVVRPGTYEAAIAQASVRITVGPLFTVVTVNGVDVYLHRVTGAIDGVGFGAAPGRATGDRLGFGAVPGRATADALGFGAAPGRATIDGVGFGAATGCATIDGVGFGGATGCRTADTRGPARGVARRASEQPPARS